jgi:hypothetical protein
MIDFFILASPFLLGYQTPFFADIPAPLCNVRISIVEYSFLRRDKGEACDVRFGSKAK